jgi:hypothetical protein
VRGKIAALAVIVPMITSPCQSQNIDPRDTRYGPGDGSLNIRGLGAITCSDWLIKFGRIQSKNADLATWFSGYALAQNLTYAQQIVLPITNDGLIDESLIALMFESHCRSSPTLRLGHVAEAVANELRMPAGEPNARD